MDNTKDHLLWEACLDGDIDKARQLINEGADVSYVGQGGKTPLAIAAYQDHGDLVRVLANEYKCDVEATDKENCSALYWACGQEKLSAVEALIDCGANIESLTKNGVSPLLVSCHVGNLKVLQLLIKKGANRSILAKGYTPLSLARRENHDNVVNYLNDVDKYDTEMQKVISDEIEMEFTKLSIHGPAGSGKTCLQKLLLNEPPPVVRNSTDITDGVTLARDVSTSVMANGLQPTSNKVGMKKVEGDQPLHLLSQEARKKLRVPESPNATDNASNISSRKQIWNKFGFMNACKSVLKRNTYTTSTLTAVVIAAIAVMLYILNFASLLSLIVIILLLSAVLAITLYATVFHRRQSVVPTTLPAVVPSDSAQKPTSTITCGMLSILPSSPESESSFKLRWVYSTDSGGQPAFQDVAPVFLRHCSVIVLTLKLNERLSDYPKLTYVHEGEMLQEEDQKHVTNLQMILNLARSLSSIFHEPCDIKSKCFPQLMIVGTFYDKLVPGMESLEEKNSILKDKLKVFDDSIIVWNENGDPIHPINTLVKPENGRTELSERLSKIILKPYRTQSRKVPLSYLIFQFEIISFAKSKNKDILTLEECCEIGHSVQINSEESVKDALKVLDSIGVLFYFQILSNLIFVKPQILLKLLSNIISLSFSPCDKSKLFLKYNENFTYHCKKIHSKGCFNRKCLEILFSQQDCSNFSADDFINLMEHLLVLVKIPSSFNCQYFMPCVLPWNNNLDRISLVHKINADPLILRWNASDTFPIPYGLFLGTIITLLSKQGEPKFTLLQCESYCHHRNAIYLNCLLNESHGTLLLIDEVIQIKLLYKGITSICPQILQCVKQSIQTATEKFHYHRDLGMVSEYFMSDCYTDKSNHVCQVYSNNGRPYKECTEHNNSVGLTSAQSVWYKCTLIDPTLDVMIDFTDFRLIENFSPSHIRIICNALKPLQSEWAQIALNMGFAACTRKIIELENKSDTYRCLFDLVGKWIDRDIDCTPAELHTILTRMGIKIKQ